MSSEHPTGPATPISMSSQQRRFTAQRGSRFATYRELMVGDGGLGSLLGLELYTLLLTNLGGLPGYGLRGIGLPLLLRACGGKLTVGRGVTIRQPGRISVGRGIILDDYATLDIRTDHEAPPDSGIELGNHVLIGRGSLVVAKNARIVLEDAVNVSSACRIASQSKVRIGASTLVAAYAYIGPGNHVIPDADTPMIDLGMDQKGGVDIGRNAWIGTRATVLDGVKIGDHAVVGAHSLVREDVPEGAIVAGCPAKILRYR